MNALEAIAAAKEKAGTHVMRPESWEGQAQGLRWCPMECGFRHLQYAANQGTVSYSGPPAALPSAADLSVSWQVVPKSVLAAEAHAIVSAKQPAPPAMPIPGTGHELEFYVYEWDDLPVSQRRGLGVFKPAPGPADPPGLPQMPKRPRKKTAAGP